MLQAEAKSRMGRIFFHDIDVLVIDRMGKEVSGAGFDPNITGRNNRGVEGFDDPLVNKIVVLDLTDATHGNATGLGLADVITRRLFDRIDYGATWANVITSNYLDGGHRPDRHAHRPGGGRPRGEDGASGGSPARRASCASATP